MAADGEDVAVWMQVSSALCGSVRRGRGPWRAAKGGKGFAVWRSGGEHRLQLRSLQPRGRGGLRRHAARAR
eukprot:7585691-Pyramimonas_sp.AAC.1